VFELIQFSDPAHPFRFLCEAAPSA